MYDIKSKIMGKLKDIGHMVIFSNMQKAKIQFIPSPSCLIILKARAINTRYFVVELNSSLFNGARTSEFKRTEEGIDEVIKWMASIPQLEYIGYLSKLIPRHLEFYKFVDTTYTYNSEYYQHGNIVRVKVLSIISLNGCNIIEGTCDPNNDDVYFLMSAIVNNHHSLKIISNGEVWFPLTYVGGDYIIFPYIDIKMDLNENDKKLINLACSIYIKNLFGDK